MAKNRPIIYFGGNKYIVFGILPTKPFISRNYIWGFEGICFGTESVEKIFLSVVIVVN